MWSSFNHGDDLSPPNHRQYDTIVSPELKPFNRERCTSKWMLTDLISSQLARSYHVKWRKSDLETSPKGRRIYWWSLCLHQDDLQPSFQSSCLKIWTKTLVGARLKMKFRILLNLIQRIMCLIKVSWEEIRTSQKWLGNIAQGKAHLLMKKKSSSEKFHFWPISVHSFRSILSPLNWPW